MRDRRIRALAAGVMIAAAGLSGCGGGPGSGGFAIADATDTGGNGIGASEQEAVRKAARQMTGGAGVRVHGLTARIAPGEEGLDICGWVDTAGEGRASLPLYVELREDDGRITAQRGQVGATPENLAKVRFMCREHEGW